MIIHLGRMRDKSRKVLEIVEVLDVVGDTIQTQSLYRFEETGKSLEGEVIGQLKKTKNELKNQEKLQKAGICL